MSKQNDIETLFDIILTASELELQDLLDGVPVGMQQLANETLTQRVQIQVATLLGEEVYALQRVALKNNTRRLAEELYELRFAKVDP